jgi:hypothetical protein
MSQLIAEIIDETIQFNPELDIDAVKDIIIDAFAEELPHQLAKQDIPKRNIKLRIIQERTKRLKKDEGIRQIRKEREKSDLIHSLNLIKDESVEEYVPFNSEDYQHPHMFGTFILDTPVNNFGSSYENLLNKFGSEREIEKNTNSSLCDVVKIAKTLSKDKFLDSKLKIDKVFDKILNIKVDLNAKEALELWLKIIEETIPKYKKAVNLEWTGELNVTDDEFVEYSVQIMLKTGNGPRAVEDVDVTADLRLERNIF